MSWSDATDIERALASALRAYDWSGAQGVIASLVDRLYHEADPLPRDAAERALLALRRKRRFNMLARLAEALMRTGQDSPLVRRHYAQALVDRGLRVAPEMVLEALAASPSTDPVERAEAHGLLGRIYKQLYVAARTTRGGRAPAFLSRAIAEYRWGYDIAPAEHHWHAVNVAALTVLAARDGVSLSDAVDPASLARDILARLDGRLHGGPARSERPHDVATRMEAWLVLGQPHDAQHAALDYVSHPDTDSFEAAGTLRQLTEVWMLTSDLPPGSTILPLIQSAQLRGEGGAVGLESLVQEIDTVQRARKTLERVFGDDRTQTIQWYEEGLKRARSVARIERPNGRGHGTGWLVDAAEFLPGRQGVLMLTNAHVVNAEGGQALLPEQARANFQGAREIVAFDRVEWSSPVSKLDATLLSFSAPPKGIDIIPLSRSALKLQSPPQRVYIMGHPGGRDLEFSLHDNRLLACSASHVHYRTPTEGGSSGSPVFDSEGWQAVALHHAGSESMARLDDPRATYRANEGILIGAIREESRK
jgi:hypothetical protein